MFVAAELTTFRPVYHFVDERLFKAFIERLPRASLVAPLRRDEALRNRYFPGFRISENKPTQQQVLSAYKREVVEGRNRRLANVLCEQWIRSSRELTTMALKSLGLSSEDPASATTWINKAQRKLEEEQGLDVVHTIVRTMSPIFASEDILIFISIIGYGRDQQALLDFVRAELQVIESTGDPSLRRESLENELQSAQAKFKLLEESLEDLNSKIQAEVNTTTQRLDEALRDYEAAELSAAKTQSEVGALAEQIEQVRRRLIEREQVLKDQNSHKNELSEIVERHREQVETISMRHREQRDEIDKHRRDQTDLVNRLAADIQRLEEQIPVEDALATHQVKPSETPSKSSYEGLGNNAICYQGLQRLFRNNLVGFLRERLPRIFPTDHAQRVKKLFGEQWEKAAINATTSRQIGGTATSIRDEYDLLGTNHFFEIFDKFYDKLFTPEAGQPAGLPKPVKTKFLGNLKTIKDGRDPLSHPVEEEISFEEAHHLLIEAKQILSWLGFEKGATELSALAAQLGGSDLEPLAIVRRLPSEDSIYQEFVGRGTVLTDLAACFASPDSRRCLLAGDGGKGKSAVAYRFAQTLSTTPGRFQLIVWLSAKQRRFQDGTITTLDLPDFATAEEAVDRLLSEYGATSSDLGRSPGEKRQLLMEYLDTLPAFIIADDIDTVLDDYDVVSLFTHEIPHTKSAVLLTSRRDIPGIRSFVLKEFDAAEAREFVSSRIHLYGLDARLFPASVVSEIAKVTDGSPLYMDDLLRLTRIIDVKSAVKMWAEKRGNEARKYALQRELEQLSAEAKRVLIAAAITDDPISFAELETILGMPEERLVSTLKELQTLFLFPKPRIVEDEQRFQINLNTKKLVRLVEGSSDMYARVERACKAVAGKLPHAGQGVISSLIRQAYLRLNAGKHAEAESILQEAIEKYPNVTDLHGFLGYAYKRSRRVADARAQFDIAAKLKGSKRETFLHWIRMEISVKEWSKAISIADQALKIDPDFYEMTERKVYAQRQAGFDFHRGLHREKAERLWADAVEEVRRTIKAPEDLESGARPHNASMFCTAVICLDMLGRFRERDQWLERWEKEHPDDDQVAWQKEFLRNKRGASLQLHAL
jgi:tetratricopeptide (TPR) repeat protein